MCIYKEIVVRWYDYMVHLNAWRHVLNTNTRGSTVQVPVNSYMGRHLTVHARANSSRTSQQYTHRSTAILGVT